MIRRFRSRRAAELGLMSLYKFKYPVKACKIIKKLSQNVFVFDTDIAREVYLAKGNWYSRQLEIPVKQKDIVLLPGAVFEVSNTSFSRYVCTEDKIPLLSIIKSTDVEVLKDED